jgi:hypothetical protein
MAFSASKVSIAGAPNYSQYSKMPAQNCAITDATQWDTHAPQADGIAV